MSSAKAPSKPPGCAWCSTGCCLTTFHGSQDAAELWAQLGTRRT